jgi:ligand-binding sensor domain-containing protein/two-component sensor histidine kinase
MKFSILALVCAGLFCLLVAVAAVQSDTTAQPLPQYVHDSWQTDQGLPQNSVFAIVQTQDGYIWVATQEGLVRFDGIRFSVFDKLNTPEITENNCQVLFVDHEGILWAGTEGGGIVRRKDGQFKAFTTADGLADNIVEAIYEDHEGNLWIGTLGGLSRFRDGRFVNFTTRDGLPRDTVLSICGAPDGALWIGTEDGGLSRLKDGRFTTYTVKDGLADNLVRVAFEDRAGNLWAGTRKGLSCLRDGKFSTFKTKDGLPSDSILTIYQDRDGVLWIGTLGGLVRYESGVFTPYTAKDGLTEDRVASIHQDREGNLWIGTLEGGLNRLKEGRFSVYSKKEGLPNDIVRPVFQDSSGVIWIGTPSGLGQLREGKLITYSKKDGLPIDNIVALQEDHAGNLWIGTSAGLSRLSNGKFVTYTTRDGLSDDTVLSICSSRDGSVWIGTASGLSQMKDGRISTYTTRDGLTNDSIWALYEDGEGTLFIGTDGGGLNRYQAGRFTALTTKDGLANDIVLSIHGEADAGGKSGSLWIGTSGGLSCLKDGSLSSYRTKDGLFDDVVFQILEDDSGNLWMSSNKGIFRVSKQELDDFAKGKISTINSPSYGTADGMKSRECNGGFQPAGWRTRDGKLWFPTIKGVAIIDPGRIKLNQLAPPTVIERVLIDHKPIDLNQNDSLEPGKSKFEFHFTGLSFVAPEKVRFKYKLEGFDPDWTDCGNQREASYTNIPPGEYTFHVRACNNDGIWNETGASFSFYLKPHFYQTYWFYCGCIVIVGIFGAGLYRFRVKHIEAQFSAVLAERNRIAREIHDTLAQGFAGISLQLEAVDETLSESPSVARNHLNKARSLVRKSLAEARRSVWELRSPALDSADLPAALSDVAQQLTANSLRVSVSVKGDRRRLPSAVEENLLRIGREALTNAVKHGRAQTIDVDVNFETDRVLLNVRDDGCGFDPDRQVTRDNNGFGLISMRERAESIGAQLNVRSSPGNGTVVTVEASV